jgi:hypothetical protein
LLTNTNKDAQNYLDLEAKVKQLQTNLNTSEENITNLKTEVENKEKEQVKAIKDKQSQIAKLTKQKESSKELIFNLQKELRDYELYHQREIKRLNKITKEHQKQEKQAIKALEINQEQITNLTKELKETQQTLAETTNNLLETKELLSIYNQSDALSFFNTSPELVIKLLKQHSNKLYYFFYSTENNEVLDLSSIEANLQDNCLFLGTFGEGKLEVNLNKEQAEVLSLRTPRPVQELFQFSKNKLFITDTTKFYKEGEPLLLDKGKTKESSTSTPVSSIYPSGEGEEKKKKSRFGFSKKDKDK